MLAFMTIRSRIEQNSATLTKSERKLATALLADYPFAGLLSIQELAEKAEVSAPSITRFTSKIGLSGYAEMQQKLLAELREGNVSPVHIHYSSERIEGGYLAGFLARAAAQVQTSGQAITEGQFDRITALVSDPKRQVFALGGRISDAVAQHLTFHLKQSRPGVVHIARDPETWPEYLLQMRPEDVVFLVDFRRYEPSLSRLAEAAAARRTQVILMTDKWNSPAKRHASEVLAVPIETGTVWDSYSAALAIVEAIVTRVAEDTWTETRARIEDWDVSRNLISEKTE